MEKTEAQKLSITDKKILEAREHFLNAAYGRFDLIDGIINKEILLMKPRIVKQQLCSLLEIDPTLVSRKTLGKWLIRYKSSYNKRMESTVDQSKGNEREKGEDIYDFKPSDPLASKKPEADLLKILL